MEQHEITLGQEVSRRVMAARLAVGLAQGLLLYWLYSASRDVLWPATAPYAMVPLTLVMLVLPVLLISSLGHLKPRQAAIWLGSALLVLLALACHDVWRDAQGRTLMSNWEHKAVYSPSEMVALFSVVFFFIAHALVMAGAQDRRLVAAYDTYFEAAWKLGIQLLFSAFFVGALFFVLNMGAQLFMLVRLDFLHKLLRESWFNVPVICAAFSCAMHVTDVRPAIVRGIRTLLLVLMSWILPVAVVIVTGFLCTLPFTGLEALWGTRHATSVLLGTTALLLVLVNAAFQNGDAKVALPLRVSARMAAILMLPVTLVAIYALALRVQQYGWSADRVSAAACLVVAFCYAAGYVWAAYQYETWLRPISIVNVIAAFLMLAVLLALFTPIADPARIGVNSQLARLAKGRVSADKFDFQYLRFDGARYGRAALEQLKQRSTGADAAQLRSGATAALAMADKDRWQLRKQFTAPASLAQNLTVWPAGAQLPASFLAQKWESLPDQQKPDCLTGKNGKCDAFIIDADGDGKPEVLLIDTPQPGSGQLFAEGAMGGWAVIGTIGYENTACKPLLEKLRRGEFTLAAPRLKELEAGGRRIPFKPPFAPNEECDQIK
ncbi:DUF4153 domain-containing protein [Duganella callida]|uniref:DUF4153 domain-containing protein n=1 Tax=Duganella callida TaxID=2561932 RepID=A0A4Y9SDE3_9BURK|nr:DUF4153 domain-containing protein [Duganella callida]TFW18509.1 DUF4153 domain-containing protein [Duganella callida]